MKQKRNALRPAHDADPVRLLMEEHEKGILYLRKLEDAAECMTTNGFSLEAFRGIAEAGRFIDTEIREHEEKEERFLFPLMERYLNGEIDSLRREHRELWREFKMFLECVSDVENMKIYTNTVRDLIRSAKTVSQLLRTHFVKEDDLLFSAAKSVLTTDEYQQLLWNIAPIRTQPARGGIA